MKESWGSEPFTCAGSGGSAGKKPQRLKALIFQFLHLIDRGKDMEQGRVLPNVTQLINFRAAIQI